MRRHREGLSVDPFLAGFVEMKLLQFISLAADGNRAPRAIDDLDGMAIVDHLERGRAVAELNGLQIGRYGPSNVDGRLGLAARARAP